MTTTRARKTHTRRGYIAGEYVLFVRGHKMPTRWPDPAHRMANDPWFAGFTDGEGCFDIGLDGRHWRLRFVLALRRDDEAVLRELADAFGGSFSYSKAIGNANQKAQWQVGSIVGMRALVAYFDRFPLRSKKARDYAVWRGAVAMYAAAAPGDERDAALSLASGRLRTGRVFA